VLLGDGTGRFTAGPGSPFPVGPVPNSVAGADFNGDGEPDLAIANGASYTENYGTITVLLNSHVPLYTISGEVTLSGSGLSGVSITLSGSQSGAAMTSASGNYSFTVPAGGDYTVAPVLNGYTFNPPSQTSSSLSGDETANFIAVPVVPMYTISGQVTFSGIGLSGVTMTLSGSQSASMTTNGSGNYSFTVAAGGTYSITPSLAGYAFGPAGQGFFNLFGDQTANFAAFAVATTYAISGQVTRSGSGLAGVKMTLSGSQSGAATSKARGVTALRKPPAATIP